MRHHKYHPPFLQNAPHRLDIALKNGKPDGVNVPFHFSVRFRDNCIVRNSLIQRRWGTEEREHNLDTKAARNPLKAGDTFKVYIFVGNDRFLVAVNDKTFCSYAYRLPLAEVRTVEVNKDVQTILQIDHRATFPLPCPTRLRDNTDARFDFSNDIPRRFRAGHQITITGVALAHRSQGQFVVRLFEEEAAAGGGRQALHFNPRFVPYNFVAINSQNADLTWQNEERHAAAFPFAVNVQWQLAIVLADGEFRFAVNGRPFASYRYRGERLLARLGGLKIEGKDGVRVQIIGVDHVAT